MQTRCALLVALAVLALATVSLLTGLADPAFACQAEQPAGQLRNATKTITIVHGSLSEPVVEVSQDTMVTWHVLDHPVTIVFPDGEGPGAVLASASPIPLESGAAGSPLGVVLPPGGTRTLCFIEPGIYPYVISLVDEADRSGSHQSPVRGTIIVK